ncbi:MAG: AraC family transcriptional regulator, partial [Candidatus Dojkabacteria bacterium]
FDFGSIHKGDIEKILKVEKIILQDLGKPPILPDLARTIGMSETKMKSLFKKIFEDSIYNYYSSARMIEAASILKSNPCLPVSEVGYALGFSNLSHFSKMFKRHIGMKPKEYAMRL